VESPFGKVIQGIRSNEKRMRALGYPVARYKLVCFVIAGTLGGLAGYLYFALTSFVDPTLIDWLQSAQLLVIVILGGLGTLIGPALGALVLIVFIDQMSELTEHWRLYLGVLVLAMTLYGRGGLFGVGARLLGSLGRRRAASGSAAP
jgi:branched-chain amino acid transport system permease protein